MKEEFIKSLLNKNIEIIHKQVKSQKCSSVIYLPKKYKGKNVIILIENEDKINENERTDIKGRE